MSKCRCGQLKEVTHTCIDYVLPELKCPHCWHVPHGDVCYALKGCRCHYNSHSPAEPKCAECECGHGHTYLEIDGGLAPLMNQLCVSEGCDCESYRPAEPDATERARAELEVKYQQAKEFYQAYRTPEMKLYNYPIGAMLTSFLESETPRIKADAVREFVEKLTSKIDKSFVSDIPRKAFVKGTEAYQGYNNGLSTVLYILEKEFPE